MTSSSSRRLILRVGEIGEGSGSAPVPESLRLRALSLLSSTVLVDVLQGLTPECAKCGLGRFRGKAKSLTTMLSNFATRNCPELRLHRQSLG
jgi:hypothetical protein